MHCGMLRILYIVGYLTASLEKHTGCQEYSIQAAMKIKNVSTQEMGDVE
jgi:hypothetical protein